MSTCNGYANWETWNLYNWITGGSEESNRYWYSMAGTHDADTLAAMLRESHEELLDDMPNGWHRDVIAQSLSRVDWEEVAHALKDD